MVAQLTAAQGSGFQGGGNPGNRGGGAVGGVMVNLRGLGSGALGGVVVTVLVAISGGAVGPGRMADIGADPLPTLVAATVAMGIGGLVGGVVTTWWVRRHPADR